MSATTIQREKILGELGATWVTYQLVLNGWEVYRKLNENGSDLMAKKDGVEFYIEVESGWPYTCLSVRSPNPLDTCLLMIEEIGAEATGAVEREGPAYIATLSPGHSIAHRSCSPFPEISRFFSGNLA